MSGMLGNMNQAVLEINPDHAIVKKLDDMLKAKNEEGAKTFGSLLVELAGITSGYNIEDPKGFSDRLLELMEMVGGAGGAEAVQDADVV
jgi:heat shock protein beta